jgi:cytochrome oxidase Cu insertion factor (SCO1/SenC/PrrC family)
MYLLNILAPTAFFIAKAKIGLLLLSAVFISACTSYNYPSQVVLGEALVTASGETLDGTPVTVPDDLKGQSALLIFGYVHKSQFDIDRWLIGLDMTETKIRIYELPAIKNPFAGWFSTRIDDAMREGIPRELWSDVITIYDDGDKVQRYTGNQSPKNARVLLIDANGKVKHFYDRGFSVNALNELRASIYKL